MQDERHAFSEEELRRAMEQILPREEAAAFAAGIYRPGEEPVPDGSYAHWSDDTLDLLSLVSRDCAERVRALLGLDERSAARRREATRQRFGL